MIDNTPTSSNAICTGTWSSTFSNNALNSGTIGTCTSTSNYDVSWAIKRCRNCKHGHADSRIGCFDIDGNSITSMLGCFCLEYVPLDNLEYLEYLSNKKDLK
jgi:hypothetical protein